MKKNIIFVIAGVAAIAAIIVGIFIFTKISGPGIELPQSSAQNNTQDSIEQQQAEAEPGATPEGDNNGIYFYDVEEITLENDFVDTMINFPLEEMTGSKMYVTDASDLASLADGFEQVWFGQYDESVITQQRPYIIQHDAEKGLWIVKGSNISTGEVCLGILKVMISEETGEILSAWGMK